jgi:hypothetical protein
MIRRSWGVDEYLSQARQEFARLRENSRHSNPSRHHKLVEDWQKFQHPREPTIDLVPSLRMFLCLP